MRSLVLMCLMAVTLQDQTLPPGFMSCAGHMKGGQEYIGKVNSNVCYKQPKPITILSHKVRATRLTKKAAENLCQDHHVHLPYLKTERDRENFKSLILHAPCPKNISNKDCVYMDYWVGITGTPESQYKWDDDTLASDWKNWIWGPDIRPGKFDDWEEKYDMIQTEKGRPGEGELLFRRTNWDLTLQIYCQNILTDSHGEPITLIPTTTFTKPTLPPLSLKMSTQPTTDRVYTRAPVISTKRTRFYKTTALPGCGDEYSTPQVQKMQCHKIKTVNVSLMLAEAIRHTYNNESMSYLFRDIAMEDDSHNW